MTDDTVAKVSHTVALALGKTGAYASANGRKPKKFPLPQRFDAEVLAVALATEFDKLVEIGRLTVLIIGTRADGTPGWDWVEPEDLRRALAPAKPNETPRYEVVFLSEAQALNRRPSEHSPAAWIILATALREGSIVGSARWWVQHDDEVTLASMEFLGNHYPQVYQLSGGNIADSPSLVGSLVRDLLKQHPGIEEVKVWCQDGIQGLPYAEHYEPDGIFWRDLSLPEDFDRSRIVIVPTAMEMLQIASRPASVPLEPTTDADDDDDDEESNTTVSSNGKGSNGYRTILSSDEEAAIDLHDE